jgi:hypothetical protein
MGWRVAGIVFALWAFNVAMHQPVVAVCIGPLAGWLFWRGRDINTAVSRPQTTSSSKLSSSPLAARNSKAAINGLNTTDLPTYSAITTGGPPKPSARSQAPETHLSPGVSVQLTTLENPPISSPKLGQDQPSIVTRTSSGFAGTELADPYAGKEKRWRRIEQLELLDLYAQGKTVINMAYVLGVDQKQVAIKLMRLLLSPSGDIENADGCSRHGMKYTKEELRTMADLQGSELRLRTIANEVQRTQLGVGWKLLDLHVPKVPTTLRGKLRSDP